LHLLRGTTILLVVLGHALAPTYYELGTPWAVATVKLIHSFHMHTFFFISGFLGVKFFRVDRGRIGRTILRQLKRLGLVYLFYSGLGIGFKLLVPSSLVYRSLSLETVFADILLYPHLNPILALWFIYALLAIQLCFLGLNAVLRLDYHKPVVAGVMLVLLLAANLSMYGTPLDTLCGWGFVGRYALYFYVGFLAGQTGGVVEERLCRYRLVILPVGLVYFACLWWNYSVLQLWAPLNVLFALVGIAVNWTLAIHLSLSAGWVRSFFSLMAKYSYEIYLNSGMLQAATRMAVLKGLPRLIPAFAPLARPVLLAAGVVIGLAAPVLLTWGVYSRFVWLRRLAMGDWKTRPTPAAGG